MKLFAVLFFFTSSLGLSAQDQETKVILWDINRLDSIGGLPVTIYGDPQVVETDSGMAIEFDGIDDGLLIESNPLAGAEEFSIEVIFKPYPGGLEEQRFIHMEQDNDNRALIELRSASDNMWFLDTFIKSGSSGTTLYAEDFLHSASEWWHACLVYKDDTMRHYVNGSEELKGYIPFQPVSSGKTSLGVRQNLVSWYKGIIKILKITHRALEPDEFLTSKPPTTLKAEQENRNEFKIFPNPIGTEASIRYHVDRESRVTLKIYNLQLMEIESLVSAIQPSGMQQVQFNRKNLPPGIYYCVLQVDSEFFTQKILVLNDINTM
jgi:hypothetical protein